MAEVSFKASPAEYALVMKAVDRFEAFYNSFNTCKLNRLNLMMDLIACHANGTPLRLEDLVETKDEFSFVHDVGGIRRHMNRDTGKLEDCFLPRFAKPVDHPFDNKEAVTNG